MRIQRMNEDVIIKKKPSKEKSSNRASDIQEMMKKDIGGKNGGKDKGKRKYVKLRKNKKQKQ